VVGSRVQDRDGGLPPVPEAGQSPRRPGRPEQRQLVKFVNTNGEESVELLEDKHLGYPEQRCRWIARSKGSGRGFSGDVNIIDEAFAYTNEQHEALLPTASARQNPQFIYTSSPPLDGISGDVLFRLRHRGDPTAPRTSEDGAWSQDAELAFRDWGAADDLETLADVDLDDEAMWRATNPSLGRSRLTMEAIARERRSIPTDAGFARERCGVWPRRVTSGAGVISAQLWEELATTAAEGGRPTDVAFAVVVAPDRSRTTIIAVGPQDDGRLQGSVVAYMPGTDGVVSRMEELDEKYNPVGWAVEDKGATASLWPELERRSLAAEREGRRLFKVSEDPDNPQRRDLVAPWANDVVTAYGLFIDACKEKRFAHLHSTPLDTGISAGGTRPLGSGTTWDHRSAVDVSPNRGVTNGFWLYVTRAHLVVDDRAPNLW
jgi:hypothetical protein